MKWSDSPDRKWTPVKPGSCPQQVWAVSTRTEPAAIKSEGAPCLRWHFKSGFHFRGSPAACQRALTSRLLADWCELNVIKARWNIRPIFLMQSAIAGPQDASWCTGSCRGSERKELEVETIPPYFSAAPFPSIRPRSSLFVFFSSSAARGGSDLILHARIKLLKQEELHTHTHSQRKIHYFHHRGVLFSCFYLVICYWTQPEVGRFLWYNFISLGAQAQTDTGGAVNAVGRHDLCSVDTRGRRDRWNGKSGRLQHLSIAGRRRCCDQKRWEWKCQDTGSRVTASDPEGLGLRSALLRLEVGTVDGQCLFWGRDWRWQFLQICWDFARSIY